MSNIWKIAIAITLVCCLGITFISCDIFEEEGTYVYVTDEAGETILDENNEPITEFRPNDETTKETEDEGDDDNATDGEEDDNSNGGTGTGISNAGGNTDSGYGEIIRPSGRK